LFILTWNMSSKCLFVQLLLLTFISIVNSSTFHAYLLLHCIWRLNKSFQNTASDYPFGIFKLFLLPFLTCTSSPKRLLERLLHHFMWEFLKTVNIYHMQNRISLRQLDRTICQGIVTFFLHFTKRFVRTNLTTSIFQFNGNSKDERMCCMYMYLLMLAI